MKVVEMWIHDSMREHKPGAFKPGATKPMELFKDEVSL